MLQKLNLIMNQTLPATYDDSLSYYEALSKICYEVNEIIDRINADEALIAANSEAIKSLNSQIASINNSLEADAEKIQLLTTQINGLLQTMLQLATEVNDLGTRVNKIESDFNTGFETPHITLTQALLPGSPSNWAATKAYVDSKISNEFTPIVLTGDGGPAVLTQMTVRFDKTGLIIYGSISQDELPGRRSYTVFASSTLKTLANGIAVWVGDALAKRSILVPIFTQLSTLDSPTLDSERWFSLSFDSSGVLSGFTYVKGTSATTNAPNFVAQTVI